MNSLTPPHVCFDTILAAAIPTELRPLRRADGPASDGEHRPKPLASRQTQNVAKARHREALRVLWIDDEIDPDDALLVLLRGEGISVEVAESGSDGLTRALANVHDAILLDLKLPDMFGLTVLRRLTASQVTDPVIVVTAYYLEPEIEADARRLGAAGILHKPFLGADVVVEAVNEAAENQSAGARAARVAPHPAFGIVAVAPAMRDIVAWAESIARSKLSVLLTGETGTGKDLVARAIHEASPRRTGPFVPVNCGAIPDSLFESELFGHRKGAFTGASEQTTGLIEAAEGGTLFLDEVGEIPLSMQARLLRCLEDGRVRHIGETRERTVDVRVIAATNRSLQELIARRQFRQDLYFRLSGASCEIPPLRERLEDIEGLIRYWLPRLSERHVKRAVAITPEALGLFRAYHWPGNARELRNVLEHAVCLTAGSMLTERDVSTAMSMERFHGDERSRGNVSDRDRLQAILEANRWNRTRTAHNLGIGRTTLWRWLRNGDHRIP